MEYNEKQMQIMEAAEVLFAEQGFNGTSVRDIAEKANVNLAMISYYFGSKEKLLEAIFGYRGEIMKLKLESIIQLSDLPALEKMNLLIDHYIDKVIAQQCFHRILAREQVLNTTGSISDLILQMKRTNFELIHKLVDEGQKKGEFKEDIDISLMMSTMIGTANNLITSKYYYRELNNLQQIPEPEFQNYLRLKLSVYLKQLFKIILSNEK
jgi:AcrR family transcriptional regulator